MTISPSQRRAWTKLLLKEYYDIARTHPKLTPREILEVVLANHRTEFETLEPDMVLKISKEMEKSLLDGGVNSKWDVSSDYQIKTVQVFEKFKTDAKLAKVANSKLSELKKVALKTLYTEVLNAVFSSVFGLHANNASIALSVASDRNLNKVAELLVKRLVKMGYDFA